MKALTFRNKMQWTLPIVVALAVAANGFGAVNSLTITEKAGVTTNNYPIQIGRPFVAGEIPNFPQAVVGGTPVTTQADVKQRWPDGSVKHAILSFLIPQLTARSTVTVTFQNQASGNNGPLTLAQMQASAFDFNAQMLLTNGSTLTADARTMLNNNSYTVWTSGGVAQTIILADHSPNRAYDIGFDANRSFRPIFHATFWPGINKVRVRFIGEIANTEALQDQTYSLALRIGNASPQQVYQKAAFTQSAGTRWTKEFWIGGAPPAIAINHNLAYIRDTKFVPNYDVSKTVSSGAVAAACSSWTGAAKDIFDAGNWTKYMPQAGGRPDIGPYPDWTVMWLYTGDSCIKDQAFGNADLAASWTVHYREGKTGKNMLRTDAAGAGTGIGHVVSITGRPTLWLGNFNYSQTSAADKITPVGGAGNGGWIYDPAHEPEPASVQYALSGDFWYLEEMWFWASTDAFSNPATIWDRGPTGAEGVFNHGQLRATAWVMRNRVNTAFVSPDTTPEKAYFETLINDGFADEEGIRNIQGTSLQSNPAWTWGKTQTAVSGTPWWGPTLGPTPLHQWWRGDNTFAQADYGIDTSVTKEAMSAFELHYLEYSLGRAKELGYPSAALLTWASVVDINILTNPVLNPYLISNGRLPTTRVSDGNYLPTWADFKSGYVPAWQTATNFDPLGSGGLTPPDGYSAYALAAVSMLAGETGGTTAWNWMAANVLTDPSFNANPKWAIVPRGASVAPPPPSTSRCDLNGDGAVNATDVQLAVDQALGRAACSTADLVGNGTCDVVDVQRIINASLTGTCKVGP
jgi:hypothetical protein